MQKIYVDSWCSTVYRRCKLIVGAQHIYMLFEKSKSNCDLKITVCGKEIAKCTSAKFLGTWLDNNLNWKTHFKKLTSKLKIGLGMMRCSRAKQVLYYGQVHSNLSYGISIWGPMINKGQLKELANIQCKCVDLIGCHQITSRNTGYPH